MSDIFGFKEDKILKKHSRIEDYSIKQRMGDEWYGEGSDGPSLKRLITDKRVLIIFAGFVAIIAVLFVKLFWLQVVKGDEYRLIAEGNRIRTQEIKADRGLIFDQDNTQLVENLPDFYLSVVAAELPNDDAKFLEIIHKIEKVFPHEIVKKIIDIYKQDVTYYKQEVIEEHLDRDDAILFAIECQDCQGIYVKDSSKRQYLYSDYMSHLMGYLGLINETELAEEDKNYSYDDYLGKSGLELYYENYLKGVKGYKKVEVDSRGKERQVIDTSPAEIGQSLKLTIDLDLQKKLYNTIKKQLASLETNRAVGIVMNPNNGEILAMVSYPGYENNLFVTGISQEDYANLIEDPDKPMFFRAIAGEYPPGSTIKPLIALAALEEGIVNEWTYFNSTGGLAINQWYFPDWRYGGHGITDVKKAIADSVNTYFYYIGGGYENFEGLGVERIKQYLESFNLGQPTGVDLYGERSGFIPSMEWKEEVKDERWYIGDTYHLSIGQGDLLVTPLQVANFTSMIASGGNIFQPRLVDAVIDPITKEEFEIGDKLVKRIDASQENIEIIQRAMRETVVSGSGISLSTLPFTSAGKTGTAQTGGDKENHAWYTGFAPYENPEVAITILVENGGGGDKIAVPIAKEVLAWYFNNKE